MGEWLSCECTDTRKGMKIGTLEGKIYPKGRKRSIDGKRRERKGKGERKNREGDRVREKLKGA